MDVVLPFAFCGAAETEPTHEKLLAWAAETGLLELRAVKHLFGTTRVGEFSSYAYPFASHPTRVLIDGWVLWTLAVDELFEEKLASGRLAPRASDAADPGRCSGRSTPNDLPTTTSPRWPT